MNDNVEKEEEFRAPEELLKAQSLANLLDYAFDVPILPFKIGFDSIVGLIPVIGDPLMALASLRIVYLGKKMGLPPELTQQMLRNIAIDFAFGFIPVIGDIADFFYKANLKNVRIMEQYWLSQNKDVIDQFAAQKVVEWEKEQEKLEYHSD